MALTQHDKDNLSAAQQAGIQAATERYNNATTQAERDAAHAQAEAIRNSAGYTSDSSGAYSGSYSGGAYQSAGNYYDAGLNDVDRAAVQNLQAQWWSATDTAERDRLHAAAEWIRNNSETPYSGGADGTEFIPLSKEQKQTVRDLIGNGGSAWTYGGQPTYNNAYADDIALLTQALLTRDPFSYDLNNDPLYGYYSDAYERNGQRAMKDTLGQVAARTGGMASSWAGSQAQQSYNDYMAGLNDIVPELYQLAYSMWQDDEDYQRKNLEMLQSLEQGDYNKFLNQLGQWNTDRSFDYGVYRDQVSDQRYADETAYNRSQNDFSNLMALAQLGGSYGDYSGLGRLGITPNLQNLADYTAAGSAAVQSKAQNSNSTSSGSGRTDGSSISEDDFWAQVEDYVALGGDAEDYIKANWQGTGLFKTQTAALSSWNVYQTRQGAASVSSSNGVSAGYAPNSVTARNAGNLDYDPDEGIFTWNGRKFNSPKALDEAVTIAYENGDIGVEEVNAILRALGTYGVTIK